MKGKKCFGLLLVLSIIFGLSLSVFSDVNAVTFSQNVDITDTLTPTWTCYIYTNDNWTKRWENCSSSTSAEKTFFQIKSNETYDIVSGNYYEIKLSFLSIGTQAQPVGSIWTLQNNDYFDVVDFYSNYQNINLNSWTSSTSYTGDPSTQYYGARQNDTFTIVLRAKQDFTGNIVLGNGNSSFIIINAATSTIIYPYQSVQVYEKSSAADELNEKDEQDRSNLETQSSDTDSASESSSEDAESTGTTLLGAFSAFVTALTNASPSNCNLDMDLGNLDLGVVNLCQLSPPQPIPTIASIFLILFCVPLSIATARKVINLFRSFQ